MIEYRNRDRAEQIIASLERLAMCDLTDFIEVSFQDCSDCDSALVNLDRWLASTSNPSIVLAHLTSYPRLARLLILILGASQHLADSLVQNPELAYLLLDFDEFSRIPSAEMVREEGRKLLAASTSYSHSLDRLRFLKQRWTLPIVVNDLAGTWGEEDTWNALSALADGIIELARDVAWNEYRLRKDIDDLPEIMVVAFGKLGGCELNFSSDIDLVYVCPDDLPESADKHLTRAAELYNRALSDRMGRGSLYRVDLRLRPFGGSGALVPSMKAVESYYRSYAEIWEAQALIRSRPIAGPPELMARWESLRQSVCFGSLVSERLVDEIVAMRARIEEYCDPKDLKRGAGGIRDVEFSTQILQLIYGQRHESVRVAPTCAALRALDKEGVLSHAKVTQLIEAYRFLRQLEHRCQLVGDVQTHSLPESPLARENLSRTMGLESWSDLERKLEEIRIGVRNAYRELIQSQGSTVSARDRVLDQLSNHRETVQQWFDALPESDAFYSSLQENQGSLNRVETILDHAPVLVKYFKGSFDQTENLVSGEIEEEIDVVGRLSGLPADAPASSLAHRVASLWLTIATQWTIFPEFHVGAPLSDLMDETIRAVWKRVGGGFDIVALGSHAQRDLSFGSDADLLFLVDSAELHADAEKNAQCLLTEVERLRQFGAPLSVDMRLRPDGKKGLLVRTYEGLRAYRAESMDTWERYALGQARLICGNKEAEKITLACANSGGLSDREFDELLAMKSRIENERVKPHESRRHVKLGYGGLTDIDWLVHLSELRFYGQQPVCASHDIADRIVHLANVGRLNKDEAESLLMARAQLTTLRNWIFLHDFDPDIIPENQDKLEQLANCIGRIDAEGLLQRYESTIDAVRSIYLRVLERLK